MVVILSDKKCRTEREISEILFSHGGDCISDGCIRFGQSKFTVINLHRNTDLKISGGIVVIAGNCKRFAKQLLPAGVIGICEDTNRDALMLFKKNRTPVISCGMDARNTVTVSSLSENTLIAALRRTVTDVKGRELEPAEFKIKLSSDVTPFSAMACVTALLLLGSETDKL